MVDELAQEGEPRRKAARVVGVPRVRGWPLIEPVHEAVGLAEFEERLRVDVDRGEPAEHATESAGLVIVRHRAVAAAMLAGAVELRVVGPVNAGTRIRRREVHGEVLLLDEGRGVNPKDACLRGLASNVENHGHQLEGLAEPSRSSLQAKRHRT